MDRLAFALREVVHETSFEELHTRKAPAIGGQVMDEVFFGIVPGPEAQAITLEVFIEYLLGLAVEHDEFIGAQTMLSGIESGNVLPSCVMGPLERRPFSLDEGFFLAISQPLIST
jgi:hypothetical protein